MIKKTIALIIFLSFFLCSLAVSEQLIRYPRGENTEDFRYAYPVRLLQLLLDKTSAEYGPAKAGYAHFSMNTSRILVELEKGEHLDIITSGLSREMEKRFLSIPIGIRKGILGIRLFLIDRNNQEKFSAIKTLDELKMLRAGQGFDWIDTSILKSNGFNVITGNNYSGLFHMLMQGRFDFFPRGLYEPFIEVEKHQPDLPDLTVEKDLALYYHYPDFFWVNKKNTKLAERLKKGFDLAITDGSFDTLFEEEYGQLIKKAHLEQRRIFYIPNTEADTIPHKGDSRYWLIEQMNAAGTLNYIP